MTGSGTLADPYIIWNVNDLQNMNLDLAAYYEVGQNIDAVATSTWNQLIDRGAWLPFTAYFVNDFVTNAGKKYYCIKAHTSGALFAVSDKWVLTTRLNAGDYLGFIPIGPAYGGSITDSFTGSLDGKGYKITDLTINTETYSNGYGALVTDNKGIIRNLGLVDCQITVSSVVAYARAGGVASINEEEGTIQNCSVSGTITAMVTAATIGLWSSAGGIACWNDGIIDECHSSATIVATSNKHASGGGLVDGNDGTISKSSATGDVTVTASLKAEAGGFLGENEWSGANISNCYARGNATASGGATWNRAGGFVQHNTSPATITNCYSTGTPTGASGTGGFCQLNTGTITDCFWDIESSGTLISNGGTGITTAEMKDRGTFTGAGWDFTSVWNISTVTTSSPINITAMSAVLPGILDVTIMNDLYPILQWQSLLGPPCDCGFEWGQTPTFGNLTPVESKNTGNFFTQMLSGLKTSTTYYFRARASSSGPIYGATKSFTTLVGIEVETLPATNITENSARIWGRVRKVPITAMARFDWGGNIEYGAQTPWAPGLVSDDMFYHDLRNLAEGRAYHFRAVAMGSALVYGNDMTFTTRSPVGPVVLIQEELAHLMEVS